MTDLSNLIADRFGPETDAGRDMPADGPLAAMLGRRTYRQYSDRRVSESLARVLLACAQSAAAKSDLQQYSILRLIDASARARIAELAATPWMETAPITLVFCGDVRRAWRIAEIRGHEYAQNSLDSFMNVAIDAALAMQSFSAAAEAAGLGVCFISQVRKRIDDVAELLGLPPGVFPIAGVTAGWPAGERRVTPRLPPAVVVHHDRYEEQNLEAEIDDYDRRRHARFPMARQMHTDKYGVADFYGWSENVARRLSEPEGREVLKGFLLSRGFDLA